MKQAVEYSGISLEIPLESGIYTPSDDSFLLLDVVTGFLDLHPDAFKDAPALDMGAGCGLLSYILARHCSSVDAVDINENAVAFISEEARKREPQAEIRAIHSNLFESVPIKAYRLACFNPPYLPPEGDQEIVPDAATLQGRDLIDVALYSPGGGSSLLRRFLIDVKERLEKNAHVFFIKSSLTHFPRFDDFLQEHGYAIVEFKHVHKFFEDIEAYHVVA